MNESTTDESTKSCCPICSGKLSPLSKYVEAMKYRNWYLCTKCRRDLFWDPEKCKWYALIPAETIALDTGGLFIVVLKDGYEIVKKKE